MIFPDNWPIPEDISSRVGEKAGRQRIIENATATLCILHQVPKEDDLDRYPVFCYINENDVISHPPGQITISDLIEEYRELIDELDQAYQDAKTPDEYFAILERVVPIGRAVMRSAVTVQSLREIYKDNKEILLWRDEFNEIERSAELIQTNAKNALDYENARSADQLAKLSGKLNTIAILFLPMTVVSGLFGMNLRNGIEDMHPSMFLVVIAGSLVVSFFTYLFWRYKA